ncbi:MAG TPA: YceI family protein [Marmoricola sp.]|nr:YceI family protein [Marmoricola sp.]
MSIDTTTSIAPELVAGTWTIDPSHSEVGFVARHLMTKVRGVFESFEGTIVTGENPSATAKIDPNSINTRNADRDAHLRSADFFDVENSGAITFASTGVEAGGKGLLLTGELTIKGTTRPVTLDVEVLGVGTDPWGGTRVGFEGSVTVNRKDWGIDWNVPLDGGRFLVGEKVELVVAVQAVLQQGE